MDKQKVIAVIPALNEEKTISEVVLGLKDKVDRVIVVDDGSKDNTAEIAKNAGATIISHRKREGYDKSLNDGFDFAYNDGATIIFSFDGDAQHSPLDIPMMIGPLRNGTADVIVGNRGRPARLAERLFSVIAKRIINIDDPLCGFKAYGANVYKEVGYFDNISSIGTQLVFNAHKKGFRIIQKNISIDKRRDYPRFGRRIRVSYKIFIAILKTIVAMAIFNTRKIETDVQGDKNA